MKTERERHAAALALRAARPWAQRATCTLAAAAVLALLLALDGCGGSSGSGGVDSGGTGVDTPTLAVGPISGFGSIIVAGVHYDDTGARIVDGDGQALTAAALTLGAMTRIDATPVVTVAGRPEAQAKTVRVSEAVLGPVESADLASKSVRVLGQTVVVTAATVFDATLGAGLPALAPGRVVAVFGQIDRVGARVVATRIEPRTAAPHFVVRGPVASVDRSALRLAVGGLAVSVADASTLPAALAVGTAVRLKLRTAPVAGVWAATGLSLEDMPLPDRDRIEIEGRVTDYSSAQHFSVDGLPVDATSARFEGGRFGPGSRIEVEGQSSGGTLVARQVSVEDDEGGDEGLEIEGRISALDTAARTFVVRGTTVSYAGTPRFEGGTAADLALNRKVSVKGRLATDRSLVQATSIHIEL